MICPTAATLQTLTCNNDDVDDAGFSVWACSVQLQCSVWSVDLCDVQCGFAVCFWRSVYLQCGVLSVHLQCGGAIFSVECVACGVWSVA